MHVYALALLAGCPQPKESPDLTSQIADLNAQLAAQQALIDALEDRLAAAEGRLPQGTIATTDDVDAVRTEVDGFVDEDELADALDGYVDEGALATALDGYVDDDGLETALAGYATTAQVDACVGEDEIDAYGFATEAYADTAAADALATAETYADDALDARVSPLEDDGVLVLRSDRTWTLTGEADLDAALAELDQYRIPDGVTATLQFAPGTYAMTAPIEVAHPDGARIRIEGDPSDPSQVTLEFASTDGLVVDHHGALGYFGGMTVEGDLSSNGITVTDGGFATLGPLIVSTWNAGLYVSDGGTVRQADEVDPSASPGWLALSDNVSGAVAQDGGIIEMSYAVLDTNSFRSVTSYYGGIVRASGMAVSAGGNTGVLAGYGGILDGSYATLDGSASENVVVTYGSFASFDGASSTGAGRQGFYVGYGSTLLADGASATGNTREGLFAEFGSAVRGAGMTITRNGDGGAQIEALSTADLGSSDTSNNTENGLAANWNSYVAFPSGTSDANSSYGVSAAFESVIYIASASASTNGSGDSPSGATVAGTGSSYAYSSSWLFN